MADFWKRCDLFPLLHYTNVYDSNAIFLRFKLNLFLRGKRGLVTGMKDFSLLRPYLDTLVDRRHHSN